MAIQDFTAGQVLTAAQMDSLQANDYNQTVSTKTASYTLVAADKGTRVAMNSASATTITVNTSIFSAGDTLWIQNINSGVCTITAGTATVTSAGSLAIPQWGSGTLYFTSASAAIYFPSAVTTTTSALVCVKAETTFTAVSSLTVDNVFSSTYTNYFMTFIWSNSTGGVNNFVKMRVGGVAASTNYNRNRIYSLSAGVGNELDTAQTSGRILGGSTVTAAAGMFIYQPFVAAATIWLNQFETGNGATHEIVNITHTTATAYDGFEITPSAGTITGSYAIYGYSKTV